MTYLKALLFLGLAIPLFCNGQELAVSDSSIRMSDFINPVTVVSTQTSHRADSLPFATSTITKTEIQDYSARTSDELLKFIPGAYIDRTWGVFSKNSGLSLRGLDGNNRVLITVDGIPLNKSSYGMVTWNMISPDQIQSIEVVRGPASSIYGNNAMTGVVNFTTIKPQKPLEGNVDFGVGELGLRQLSFNVGGKLANGFYWDVSPYYRTGDGYIIDPVAIRDSTSSKAYIQERRISFRTGGVLKSGLTINASYTYYKDKRGSGKKIYLPDGNYDSYEDQAASVTLSAKRAVWNTDMHIYYQNEYYKKQSESINKLGDTYKLSYTFQNSDDAGLWFGATHSPTKWGTITTGAEVRFGRIDAHDVYRTSTDDILRSGNMIAIGAFVQDEAKLSSRVSLTGGLRLDVAGFFDGRLTVKDPTKATGFSSNSDQYFGSSHWQAASPRLGIKYFLTKVIGLQAAVSSGFMPAKLDDLCSSRKITKGFKIANPNLKPETLNNVEIGMSLKPVSSLYIDLTGYYSYGVHFQYFVATGDSIDTGGTDVKPILMRDNVGDVVIKGLEGSIRWQPYTRWLVRVSASTSTSKIVKFDSKIAATNLKGMAISEVPDYLASAGIVYNGKRNTLGITYSYVGRQWIDDVNTQRLADYQTVDLHAEHSLPLGLKLWADVQNLFNAQFLDKKGEQCPGRFFMAGIRFDF
ncbi:MAG TPA: TonB-dependent receptor [Williamwhitmania sp.]|nr:TonB-dependent receptor [Williamwhitmania sp.]